MPEQRFAQRKAGYKACRFVKKFGLGRIPRLCLRLNPLTPEGAEKMEVWRAESLRRRG